MARPAPEGAGSERAGAGGAILARVARLTVTFERPGGGRLAVLDDVDLDVRAGETVALVGPSGCGKSTLLRALAGLLPTGADVGPGAVVDVARDGDRPDVAWLGQRDGLLPWRRAWGNALLGARLAGRDPEAARDRAAALLDRFGLAGFEQAWPHELSGGMRQRLALLRTVLADRRLLLLDEPFSGLDALTRRRMGAWLGELDLARAGSRGPGAVILVTHDVEEAVTLADRVVVLSDRPGRVLAEVPAGVGGDRDGARERVLELLGLPQVRGR